MSAHSDSRQAKRAEKRQPFDPERRADILRAALTVFARKGFHRTTTREIAGAAGLAEGTLYNHFRNKEEMLLAALELVTAGAAPRDESIEEELGSFLRRHLRERLSDLDGALGAAFPVILAELLTDPELRARYSRELLAPNTAPVEAVLQKRSEKGELRAGDLELTARAVPALFLGLAVLRLLGDETLAARWRDLPDAMTDLLLHGLAVGGPG